MANQNQEDVKLVASNRKAHFEYFLSDYTEAGLALAGTEIKSVRLGHASLSDSYVVIKNNEAYILGMNISEYDKGNIFNHDPLRVRKLLLHKHEIRKFQQAIQEKGYTLIATKLYLKKGNTPSKNEIVEIMKKSNLYNISSNETYKRRASTIISWSNWILGLIEE